MTAQPAEIAPARGLQPPSAAAIPSPQVGHASAATGRVGGLSLILPWPARVLHPNARPHWAVKAKAAKQARADARVFAMAAGWHLATLPAGKLHLWLTFYPPNRHKHDDDGCLSAFKPWRDGLADALKIDDARFVSRPLVADEVRKGGAVLVRITAAPGLPL